MEMLQSWAVLTVGLFYLAGMFLVATWGERFSKNRLKQPTRPRPLIYVLTLAVYCTSWTYFGSVGGASRSGYDFLPIYIGPILVFIFGNRLIQRIAAIAKQQNIASIADFLSARYGKSEALGALVAIIASFGVVPYISIQLKAVSLSLQNMIAPPGVSGVSGVSGASGHLLATVAGLDLVSLLVAVTMAGFSILFGTRHIDTTEHQEGILLAVAMDSVVKLVAFISVGLFVVYFMMGGFSAMFIEAQNTSYIRQLFTTPPDLIKWCSLTLLSALAILLLPRQFHVAIVENAHPSDIRKAAFSFPVYLVAINLFVVPLAISGLLLLDPRSDGDLFVLTLPQAGQSFFFSMVAFVGGLSAATAMVIVEALALAIMISNNLVVPLLLRNRAVQGEGTVQMGRRLVATRRGAIIIVLTLSYACYIMIGNSAALVQIGLVSFAAVAQFAPAFFGGMFWKRATALGAMAGILVGTFVWIYTLLLPVFVTAGWIDQQFLSLGPFGLSLLRPQALMGLSPDSLTHGVVWSLSLNCFAYICFSLLRQPSPVERVQAAGFINRNSIPLEGGGSRLWRTSVSMRQLEQTVARYLGEARARKAFQEFIQAKGTALTPEGESDVHALRFAENLLARAVGVASSRLVMGLLLERNSAYAKGAIRLLDDASAAIQYNRDLLQSAIDNVDQGIAVFDASRRLSCWNNSFTQYLNLSPELERAGTPILEIVKFLMRQTDEGEQLLAERVRQILHQHTTLRLIIARSHVVIEISSNAMPNGGTVVTFLDVTENVRAAEALQKSNEDLENRVASRTGELTQLNLALTQAKAEAETANRGKTSFIAAASHDILQSLNAARLFTASLNERLADSAEAGLARNVEASLEAVEDILTALLDIARLDAGAMTPDIAPFRLDDLVVSLVREYAPAALLKGLDLRYIPCHYTVISDRKLLRRILQNFISNAIKYTQKGRILIGARQRGTYISLTVYDTGIGIAPDRWGEVFEEFKRLNTDDGLATGLGLGLSIVSRIAHILGVEITLRSTVGRGSMFGVYIPAAKTALPIPEAKRASNPPSHALQAARVLVVDNEPAILEAMTLLLQGWGCKVEVAGSIEQALTVLKTLRDADDFFPDIILADYHLGPSQASNENGILLIMKLRQLLQKPTAAILITADRSVPVAELAAAQDIHVLRKPVKPAALRAAMRHVLP